MIWLPVLVNRELSGSVMDDERFFAVFIAYARLF